MREICGTPMKQLVSGLESRTCEIAEVLEQLGGHFVASVVLSDLYDVMVFFRALVFLVLLVLALLFILLKEILAFGDYILKKATSFLFHFYC